MCNHDNGWSEGNHYMMMMNTLKGRGLDLSGRDLIHARFLSPPVQPARLAHMHRFLSVCLSVCPHLTEIQT